MEKLQVNIILEILGRPAENVLEGLKILLNKLESEKGIKIIEQVTHPPLLAKDSKDLFTSFAEVTLELDSLNNYFGLILGYMPSHIEIIYPEKITLVNEQLNSLGNQLLLRMHDYDAIAKKMIFEKDIAIRKLREIAPHLFEKKAEKALVPEKKTKAKKPKKKSS